MGWRFTHNATTAAYLLLLSLAGVVVLDQSWWGVIALSGVTWPLVLVLKQRLTRADTDQTGR
jgi:hypothetical protein